MWLDPELVKQSEVRQKEKNKYCILTQICGIRKMVQTNLFAGVGNGLWPWQGRRGGGVGRLGLTYTLPGVKQTAGRKLFYGTGSSAGAP